MKKFGLWAAFAASLYVLQTSLFPLVAFHGISVDFMLLLTMSLSLLKGRKIGVLSGFLMGLAEDLATGTYFGTNTFAKMSVGFICGKLSEQIFKDQLFLPLMGSAVATAINFAVLLMFAHLMGYEFNAAIYAAQNFPPCLVWQLIFTYPVHKLVLRTNEYAKTLKRIHPD